ncbi:MAG: virulence RhuM family protein [Dysgonamonadaceae bacterium]|nr:virulence RhuM family protein [Dysgonamonadaceae bacterium]
MTTKDEIVLYQPDNSIRLDVRVERETVWINRQQMALLFDRDVKTIGKHINNALKEELAGFSVVANFATTATDGKIYQVEHYNLDMVISVGYRVKSNQGIQFRAWATSVLKDYLLRGYAIGPRIEQLEYRMTETEKQIAFFVQKALPPIEGIFYNGQVFDAYTFAAELIKSAKKSIVLIDNYIDETVLTLLSKRKRGVSMTIYTPKISAQLQLDLEKHQAQYAPIAVETFPNAHDRFLIIDNEVYHIGASLKDLGKKLFAFSKLGLEAGMFTALHKHDVTAFD